MLDPSPGLPRQWSLRAIWLWAIALALPLIAVPIADAAEPTDTVGVVDAESGRWFLRNPDSGATTSFYFGNPGDVPFAGDWDCDGVDTPGLYRPADGYVYLRNSNTQGIADIDFYFGDPGDLPLPGDFNGDGCDTVSLYRPSNGRFYVINRLGSGATGLGSADSSFTFGDKGDAPFVGDFNGDGIDTMGLHRQSSGLVFLRYTNTTGTADAQFVYGNPGDRIVAGKWSGHESAGNDVVGTFRPATASFYLNDANRAGVARTKIPYGKPGFAPVAGDFGDLPDSGFSPPPYIPGVTVLGREAWGAAPANTALMSTHMMTSLTVHHAGDQESSTGPPRFRTWQHWHTDRGWGDLAYHYIIGVDGTVYQARDTRYKGDTGTNYDTAGHFLVVVEGNFEIEHPTAAQLDSLVRVLAWAAEEFDVSPSTIGGHRDYAATACPGENLHPYIESGGLEADVRSAMVGS
ncbi:MAG: peptidoglycan recognition protein family protein [Acidimicrobiia bacterium]